MKATYTISTGHVLAFCPGPVPALKQGEALHTLTDADKALLAANRGAKFRVVDGALAVLPPAALTPEQLAKKCADHSQARLDGLARSWEYDNITTLRAAALSSIPRFKAEGEAGQAAWDAEWSAAQTFKAAALAGQVAPSFENYVAALPALPERPSV